MSMRDVSLGRSDEVNRNECSICLDPVGCDKATLVCKHLFHEKCIEDWLQRDDSCPLCRREIQIISCASLHSKKIQKALECANILNFEKAYSLLDEAHCSEMDFMATSLAYHQTNNILFKHVIDLLNVDDEKALRLLTRSIESFPGNSRTKSIRGLVLEKLGRSAEALLDLDSALRLDAENTVALTVRWDIYYKRGELDKAIRDLEALIKLEPGNQMAIEKLGKLEQEVKVEGLNIEDLFLKINGIIKILEGFEHSIGTNPSDPSDYAFELMLVNRSRLNLLLFKEGVGEMDSAIPRSEKGLSIRRIDLQTIDKLDVAVKKMDGVLDIYMAPDWQFKALLKAVCGFSEKLVHRVNYSEV